MNKKYLEELYRIKFELQAKIEEVSEQLKSDQMVCSSCNWHSGEKLQAKKEAYECAEKYNDAAINFYFSIHS